MQNADKLVSDGNAVWHKSTKDEWWRSEITIEPNHNAKIVFIKEHSQEQWIE